MHTSNICVALSLYLPVDIIMHLFSSVLQRRPMRFLKIRSSKSEEVDFYNKQFQDFRILTVTAWSYHNPNWLLEGVWSPPRDQSGHRFLSSWDASIFNRVFRVYRKEEKQYIDKTYLFLTFLAQKWCSISAVSSTG